MDHRPLTSVQQGILTTLTQAEDQFVSGEQMASRFGVSRAAVMKSVHALLARGYQIESVRNRGYCLRALPDQLSEAAILERLRAGGVSADVHVFDIIDSTNNEAKRRAHDLARPLLLVADQQLNGRGRQGHSFYSPSSTGLYMTVVWPTALSLDTAALCTQVMAVAAATVIEECSGLSPMIKWVNDLFLNRKKIAGILTEAVADPEQQAICAVVCGIGINLTTERFPSEIAEVAGSLGAINRNVLAADITAAFLRMSAALPRTDHWLDAYRERSMALGRPLSFSKNGQSYHGMGKKIDDQGHLTVQLDDGTDCTLSSGEISIHPDDLP